MPISALLLVALLQVSPTTPEPSPAPAAPAPAATPATRPAHDRDPWVFRCVLDDNARMLIISLGDGWWMAFDTVHCGVYKLWQGEIELTGAVYDTKHGPQPHAKGRFVVSDPISWVVGPQEQHHSPQWLGYLLKDDRVTLNWRQGPVRFALSPSLKTDHIEAQLTTTSDDKSQPVSAVLGLVNGYHVTVQPLSGHDFEAAAAGMVSVPASGKTLVTIDIREDPEKPRSTVEAPK